MQHGLAIIIYNLWYVKIYPSQNQDLSTPLERSYKELLNALISFETCHSKLELWAVKKMALKWQKSLCSMGYNLWYVKIDPSQNQDLNTSLERSYKELLNALISFEIRHSKLKLWAIKESAPKSLNETLCESHVMVMWLTDANMSTLSFILANPNLVIPSTSPWAHHHTSHTTHPHMSYTKGITSHITHTHHTSKKQAHVISYRVTHHPPSLFKQCDRGTYLEGHKVSQ